MGGRGIRRPRLGLGDELLVLGVLEVVLRHCVHVVEPEELALASSRTMARMIVIILTG